MGLRQRPAPWGQNHLDLIGIGPGISRPGGRPELAGTVP